MSLFFYLPSWGYLELGFPLKDSIFTLWVVQSSSEQICFFFRDMSQKIFENTHWFGNNLFSSPRFPFIQALLHLSDPWFCFPQKKRVFYRKTRMLRCQDSGEETLSTLNYAARAKTIRLNASLALDVSLDIARCGSVSKNPQNISGDSAFNVSKHLFCKYLEDLGCL